MTLFFAWLDLLFFLVMRCPHISEVLFKRTDESKTYKECRPKLVSRYRDRYK